MHKVPRLRPLVALAATLLLLVATATIVDLPSARSETGDGAAASDFADTDGDGVRDEAELDGDTDGDGLADVDDPDDDGDGVATRAEGADYEGDGYTGDARDTDADGIPDYLDDDDDGDGRPTATELADPNGDGLPSDAVDNDGDAEPDYLDAEILRPADLTTVGATATIAGLDFDARFGTPEAIGDVNGDGVVDLAVGAFGDDTAGPDVGAVYVLMMRRDGSVATTTRITAGTNGFGGGLLPGGGFGFRVAGMGDIDADGVPDMVVSAYRSDRIAAGAGEVWVLLLTRDGGVRDWQVLTTGYGGFDAGLAADDQFGVDVAAIGDANGDGINDLAVGAWRADGVAPDTGAVHLVYLRADGTAADHRRLDVEGLSAGAGFGVSVDRIGDVDDSGTADLIVGAIGGDDSVGVAHVLFMAPDGTVASSTVLTPGVGVVPALAAGARFGSGVAGVGDVDRDLTSDIAVGAFGVDDDAGAAWLFTLAPSGQVETAVALPVDAQAGDLYGHTIAALGDLDGDGGLDIAIGAPGADRDGQRLGSVGIVGFGAAGAADPGDADDPAEADTDDPTETDTEEPADPAETDSDGDGISDAIEGDVDTDGDGVSDFLDVDDDNDGVLTVIEGSGDVDGDGIPNNRDADADGDGVADGTEGGVDPDGDGVPSLFDDDADGDGVADSVEGAGDTDSDGVADFLDTDSDDDGIADGAEADADTDGDGAPDRVDADGDGDGTPDADETEDDVDGDGLPGHLDPDSDNDGIADGVEGSGDTDGDGLADNVDVDADNDGLADLVEGDGDADGDGIANYRDDDADGDGLADSVEGAGDENGNGIADFLDESRATAIEVALVVPATVTAGQQLQFTLEVLNNGPAEASATEARVVVPDGITIDPATTPEGCVAVGQVVTCVVGELGVDETAVRTIAASVPAGSDAVELALSATVQANEGQAVTEAGAVAVVSPAPTGDSIDGARSEGATFVVVVVTLVLSAVLVASMIRERRHS